MRAQTVRIPNRLFPAWNTLTKSIRTTIADQRGIEREDIRTDDIFERLIDMAAAGLGVGKLICADFRGHGRNSRRAGGSPLPDRYAGSGRLPIGIGFSRT